LSVHSFSFNSAVIQNPDIAFHVFNKLPWRNSLVVAYFKVCWKPSKLATPKLELDEWLSHNCTFRNVRKWAFALSSSYNKYLKYANPFPRKPYLPTNCQWSFAHGARPHQAWVIE
jgi:hypothetical protein